MQINDPKHTRTHIDLMTLNTRTHTHTYRWFSVVYFSTAHPILFIKQKERKRSLNLGLDIVLKYYGNTEYCSFINE